MATVVRMPSVMAGATEAALQSWLVAVGDAVSEGQPIAEIETEKAVFEHEADASGVIARLLVEPGVAVAVGAPIAILADAGESVEQAVAAAGASTDAVSSRPADSLDDRDPVPEPMPVEGSPPARLFASPLVRRLAAERGIELGVIQGSGPGGRIVRRDLEGLAASLPNVGDAPQSRRIPPESSEIGSGLRDSDDGGAGYTETPHTGMRRAIARRLTESVTTVPQFQLVADCRVDALVELRRAINAGREHPVSLNDLVVKAVGAALAAVPEANAIWMPDAVRRFVRADIGVAIAIDGGLVTPVVAGVDRLPLGELSAILRDVAERARAGRLRQSELEGGSFAVSNLGMYGTKEFSAIINPPHSAILAVGAIERRPVVGEDGALAAASVMTVTLTADHRVLDGALAAQWLAAFRRVVENPVSMLV